MLAGAEYMREIVQVLRTRDNHDARNPGMDEVLDRVKDDRLVVEGEEVLVCRERDRSKPGATSPREDDRFPYLHDYLYDSTPYRS